MSYVILSDGFEHAIRTKLGITISELENSAINNKYVAGYAEKIVVKRVPDYALITDDLDLILLESSVISYICYMLCPSLARRLNNEVLTIDVTWKKSKIDWMKMAQHFLLEYEENLSKISSVTVEGSFNYPIGGIANFGGE